MTLPCTKLRSICWGTLAVAACVTMPATAHAQRITAVPHNQATSLRSLRSGFTDPPPSARLRCYWWWLNGNTDKPTITHDLEEMKAKGFGGALLVDANGANQSGNRPVPAGPTFASPAWVELYTHALREADRLGLEITFNITSGWNLGGPSVTPEQASKLLTYARAEVTGGARVTLHLPAPETRNGFYRQIAVLAYPLQHGSQLAPQPDDRQGDRHTAGQEASARGGAGAAHPAADVKADGDAKRSATTLRYRAATAESGFSMPDSGPLLNDGLSGPDAQFAGDPNFSDTPFEQVRDVSAQVSSDGVLTWDAPGGQWEVLRVGYTDSDARVSTSSGAWQGLAIDYMSREAFESYWNATVEPLLTAAKPYRSLKYLATDSWELGGTNWTPRFREQFLRLRGYDPVPWLPVVAGRIVGDRARSTRFLTDLRRTVADLVVTEHYDVFAANARKHGMGVEAESGGPHGAPIDALETFRHAAIPQTEFWSQNPHRNTDVERFFTKEAASAANIYGQRFVAQEGETSIGPQWSESLATDLKPAFDMAITEGMNRLVWHEFTSSPASTGLPGQEYFAGTHLNPKVTWWNAGTAFFQYLNRVQFLMQQGVPANDVLYFYGDNVPNFVRLKADDPAHVLPGYDYDVVNEDALLHTIRTEGADLVGPSGIHWRLLAMPRTRRVSPAVLEVVNHYVRGGGTVVGMPPLSVTGNIAIADQEHFHELVKAIWGGCQPGTAHALGRGHVYCTDDAHAVLRDQRVPPDFALEITPDIDRSTRPYASSTSGMDYVHRRIGAADVYFVRNASDRAVTTNAFFRVNGNPAELWDPLTASVRGVVKPKSTADGRTLIPLSLPPFGSTVVVFSREISGKAPAPGPERTETLRLIGPWSLHFDSGPDRPSALLQMNDLKSWTESADPNVRFFSGTATYRASIEAPMAETGSHIFLSFHDVREVARVRINGKEAGTVWAKPYAMRVDSLLHPGKNTVEIEVTNLWPNRIIGDLQPGANTSTTATNITAYKPDSPLLPSGLIGPAEWIIEH